MRHRLLLATALLPLCVSAQVSVLANRYDFFSHALNNQEQKLTSQSVNAAGFGKLFSYYVDGAVYAQPLYVPNVTVTGQGVHDVLYVATMNDKVYAFDAARPGAPLWMRDFTNESAGVTPVPISDITNSNDLNVVGNAGIEGTPVIDMSHRSLYLVARTKENGRYVQHLHSLDIASGKDRLPAVTIEARVKGTATDAVEGFVQFDAKLGNQRAALALSKGKVIVAWASHEDIGPYHGWIMAYDAGNLRQAGTLCITPDATFGGIWQSGRGPAVDSDGALYFETGNGGWDGERNVGNSIIKVLIDATSLRLEAFYTPHDYEKQNKSDADLGSTGPMLLPDSGLLLCGNKQGKLLLLDTKHLGGLTPEDKGILQELDLRSGRVLAGPAYWKGPSGETIFIWNETGVPQAIRITGERLNTEGAIKGKARSHASPGGALTVSSNGAAAGSGILWATVGKDKSADHGNAQGVLHAFNAETLEELWNSEDNARRDRLGTLVKFVPPVAVAGRVYVPNYDNAVNVYGLLTR